MAKRQFDLVKGLEKIFKSINDKPSNIQHFKTIGHCCAFLKMHKDTWYDHIKNTGKWYTTVQMTYITDSIKELKALQLNWWIDIGLSGKVNSTAWVFCMKNIQGWRDKKEIAMEANVNDHTKENKEVLKLSKKLAGVLGIIEENDSE